MPSTSVTAPIAAPFTTTFTPGSGSPSSSDVTVPETSCSSEGSSWLGCAAWPAPARLTMRCPLREICSFSPRPRMVSWSASSTVTPLRSKLTRASAGTSSSP